MMTCVPLTGLRQGRLCCLEEPRGNLEETAYLRRVNHSLGTTKESALERMLSAGRESEGQAGRGLKVELRGLV